MIQKGDIICMIHFLTSSPLRAEVIETSGDNIVARAVNHFTTLNFFEEDNIAIGFEYQRRPYFVNAKIVGINKIGIITICIDFDSVFDNRGPFEKYPVSLSGEAKLKDDMKTQSVVVISIDYNDIILTSKMDYPLNEELDIIVHTNYDIMKQKAQIVYKEAINNSRFRYEMRFINLDYKIVDSTKKLLQTLVRENEKVVRRLKEET